MADVYTTTTTQGFGERLVGSIKNFIVGILLFVISFAVLYWNEGRVDFSKVAEKAVVIQTDGQSIDVSNEGKFVSVYGNVATNDVIGDGQYLVPGNYLGVTRKAEMYSWVEKESSKSTEHVGGSETTQTTYTYKKEWDSTPESNFKYPEGHQNPSMAVMDASVYAKDATIGGYHFMPGSAHLPVGNSVTLEASSTILIQTNGDTSLANSMYIFIRKNATSTLESPEVGDIRISYTAVPPAFTGTLFGVVAGSSISPYSNDGKEFYRLFNSTREEAIVTLHNEYTMSLWIFRGVGFLLMFVGLMSILSPFTIFLSFIPIFGAFGRGVAFMFSLVVSLLLSVITIVVSSIIHDPKVLGVVIVISVIAGIGILMHASKKSQGVPPIDASAPVTPTPPAPMAVNSTVPQVPTSTYSTTPELATIATNAQPVQNSATTQSQAIPPIA